MSNGASELVQRNRESSQVRPEAVDCPTSSHLDALPEDGGARTISVERFDPFKHYEGICLWWEQQNLGSSVPLAHLPKMGIVACYGGVPAAAVWIYSSDSAFCWIAFPVASPNVRKKERALVLDALIDSAKTVAKGMGFKHAVMSLRSQALESRIQNHGFKPTDRGVTHYLGDLRT